MPSQLQSVWRAPLQESTTCHVAEHICPITLKGPEHLRAVLQVLLRHCQDGAHTAPGSAPSLPQLPAQGTSHTGGAHRRRLQLCFVLALTPVFTLAAGAVNFIPFCYFVERLWGDQHLSLMTALKETIMQTWNWIYPYPWGTSLLMAVAVFPWAS